MGRILVSSDLVGRTLVSSGLASLHASLPLLLSYKSGWRKVGMGMTTALRLRVYCLIQRVGGGGRTLGFPNEALPPPPP